MLYSVREVQEQRGRNLVMHVTRSQEPTSLFTGRSLRSTFSSSLIGIVAQSPQLPDNRGYIRIWPERLLCRVDFVCTVVHGIGGHQQNCRNTDDFEGSSLLSFLLSRWLADLLSGFVAFVAFKSALP
jgi:hypothetical protein